MIRVLIVDDQTLVRQGLALLLARESDITVAGEADTGMAAIHAVSTVRPDVVLMDLQMPGMDGLEATRRLARATAIIVLTTFDDDRQVLEALNGGARGFLLKDVSATQLADAIRSVANGGAVLAPSITRALLDRFANRLLPRDSEPVARIGSLSEREVEILRLLAQGFSNREIADRLVLTEPTIKSHVSHVLTKLDARDRTQAVIAAYEAGFIRPGGIAPAPL